MTDELKDLILEVLDPGKLLHEGANWITVTFEGATLHKWTRAAKNEQE